MVEGSAGEDRDEAVRIALGGLANGGELGEIGQALFALHQRHGLFPGDVLIAVATDALSLADVSPSNSLPYSGIREKYLPEIEFRGNSSHQRATRPSAPSR